MRDRHRHSRIIAALIFALAMAGPPAYGQDRPDLDLLKNFSFRAMGPYRAGSWVTSFAVPETPARAHLFTLYVGTRNGGVWKTVNNGTTFEPIFDGQEALSIGDVALAPSNPDIVWVGTGEAYCARSSSHGDGVYKSTDAGKTWTNMGLRDSHHIARVIVHPSDPEIVYVASMGRLFSSNAERGVFKTTDGGKTWQKVLAINDKVGIIDLALNRKDPNVLYAAAYEKTRFPWHYEAGGPESGIYKTTDGGKTWAKLGGGLPVGKIGRIGFDIFQKDPNVLYAIVENANMRQPTAREIERAKSRRVEAQPRSIGGEVYRTDDGGQTWRKVNAEGTEEAFDKAPYSFNQLRVDQHDPDKLYITAQSLASSTDGGKTWHGISWPSDGVFQKAFGDWRTLWVDPEDPDRLIFGSDGGVNISYDGGKTCHHFYNIPLGEFYAVGVDMEDPYNIYGGLQDHDSWKGPSNGWSGEISLSDWVTVGGGDGMYNCIDPTDGRWLYNNREMGSMWRLDQKLGVQTPITPTREKGAEAARFNWTPPIVISPHNPAIVYTGAQVVFRSLDRGDRWAEISPDLTTNDKARQGGAGFIFFCTITTLSESPVRPGVLWAGADDGKVQVTKDGGVSWTDVTAKLAAAGAPAGMWVSRVFASPHDAGTAFVAKTGFREDVEKAHIYKTTDFGETWTRVSGDLPDKPINVVVQDRKNQDLLFAGTDHGLYATLDGGKSWKPFKNNMPWVKVTDIVIQPRENDLVVGTYGRGLYITNISPLQEIDAKTLAEDVHLFGIRPTPQRIIPVFGNYQLLGDSHISTPNEPDAVVINYWLKAKPKGKVKITVATPYGEVIGEIEGKAEPGLNTALWNMRLKEEGKREPSMDESGAGRLVEPGEYVVTLEVDGKKWTKKALIPKRTGWSFGPHPTIVTGTGAKDYPRKPVPFTQVKVTDAFWAPRIETNRAVTIPLIFKKCEETGRIDNFAIAGGLMKGKYKGQRYNDTDVYKTVEGASYSLAVHPDAGLDAYIDALIAKIAAAQEPDGYLFTARTTDPTHPQPGIGAERWVEENVSHELYNAGHLYEAAVAHFHATGKRTFLDVALKNADLVASVFGPDKRHGFPGHQVIEMGLVKLFRVTGNEKYLYLAKYFLDQRGHDVKLTVYPPGSRFAIYNDAEQIQAHKPIFEQAEAVGHAVRAAYMYSGMADIAALTGSKDYVRAVDRLWDNVVTRKMSITGGIGARHERESFGADYELPNLTAYNETCASIGGAFWNLRMFLLHGDAKYIDVMERTIYNGLISGVSLDGKAFFYANPLEADGKFEFNQGFKTRAPWFDTACCPGNVARFIPSFPGYIYATEGDALYVNLFVGSTATVDLASGHVTVLQETRYPWDGKVRIVVEPEKESEFTVAVRIPGWALGRPMLGTLYRYNQEVGMAGAAAKTEAGAGTGDIAGPEKEITLKVNGNPVVLDTEKGFVRIRRTWKKGDSIDLDLPMLVHRVVADAAVKDDAGRVAFERGPLVYCAEAADNEGRALDLEVAGDSSFAAEFRSDLLNGVVILKGKAADGRDLTLVPYFAWSNRGVGEMAVWIKEKERNFISGRAALSYGASDHRAYLHIVDKILAGMIS